MFDQAFGVNLFFNRCGMFVAGGTCTSIRNCTSIRKYTIVPRGTSARYQVLVLWKMYLLVQCEYTWYIFC